MTPEGKEKKALRKYLDDIGAFHFAPFMGGYGRSGYSDEIACIKGCFWAFEVKAPGKEPTALQRLRLTQAQAAGGLVSWGTAEEIIEDVEAWLKKSAPPAEDR